MFLSKVMAAYRIKTTVLAAAAIILAIVGLVIAKTVTRPMEVKLQTYIKICSKSKSGKWNVIDEVGPATLNFHANLLEMATGRKVGTSFVWNTKTKKGFPYRVRLVEQAKTDLNAVTGRFGVNLVFEITYKGMTARVPGTLSTESLAGPLGNIKGRRVKGVLGRNATTMKLVSVNKFQPSPKSKPLMLVCTEEYQFSPKK